MIRSLAASVTIATFLAAGQAAALSLIDQSAGLKLFLGGDVWTKPDNIPVGLSGNGLADTAGGLGYGAAGYYELRLMKLVSFEADLAYQHGTSQHKDTINGVEFTSTVTTNGWRLPLLAKLNIPVGLGRLWLGAGPEFTFAQSSSSKIEGGGVTVNVGTRDVKPIFGTAGLGLVIEVPLVGIEIPVEFRASKNFSQPSDYADRISIDAAGNGTLRAESSWVLRLGAGIGIQF